MTLAIVVLAGGSSRRFKGDKLLAPLKGKPVIKYVVENMGELTDNLYISVNRRGRAEEILRVAGIEAIPIIDIQSLECIGPARAILSSLLEVNENEVVFIPGDMPWLPSDVVERFIDKCRELRAEIASLYWENGMVEILIQYHRASISRNYCLKASQLRKDYTRPSDFLRCMPISHYIYIGEISENPLYFSNINTRDDLRRARPRGAITRKLGTISFSGEEKSYYWFAANAYASGNYSEAARFSDMESKVYEEKNLVHIAIQCLIDSLKYMKALGRDTSSIEEKIEKMRRKFLSRL